jgi:hypothetical protein
MSMASSSSRSSLNVLRWARRRPAPVYAVMGVALAVPVLGALGSAGCLGVCHLKSCSPGFEVIVTAPEPEDPEPGQPSVDPRLRSAVYRVEAQVDGGTFAVECTFDDEGEGTCDEGVWLAPPARALDGIAFVTDRNELEPLWGQGIGLRFAGTSPARWGNHEYGPDMVDVTVFREGEEAASASYVPEYELLEDFNGKGCGDCETAPNELLYVDPA